MAEDIKYIGGDNEIEDGNYTRYTGAACKALRLLCAEYTVIDGVGFGNRMYRELRGATNSSETRDQARIYCEQALKPLVDAGAISDLVIIVDTPSGGLRGLGIQAKFTDVAESAQKSVNIPSWSMT